MNASYRHPETLDDVTTSDLSKMESDDQNAVMREWFLRHFEDPAEHTPYVSQEGGYLWVVGGPYDAQEELQWEFSDHVDSTVIEEMADELAEKSHEWAPGPEHEDLRDAYVDVFASSAPLRSFRERLASLRELSGLEYPAPLRQAQYQLLSAAAVSAMEAYLGERAVRGVSQNEDAFGRFIETHPTFRSHKVAVAEVPKLATGLLAYATSVLARTVWHRLDDTRRILERTFDVKVPHSEDLKAIIRTRHDIVHRAGVTADGTAIELGQDVLALQFDVIEEFVDKLEPQLPLDEDTAFAFEFPTSIRQQAEPYGP